MSKRTRYPPFVCASAALLTSALLVAPFALAHAFVPRTPTPTLQSAAATTIYSRNMKTNVFSGGGGDDDEGAAADTSTRGSSKVEGKEKVPIGTYNPLRLAVLKLGFTELRWTSPLNYEKREGQYKCANCGTLLFNADGTYDSGSGWPSFFRTAEGKVSMYREWDGRIECRCGKCEGHLGHVFPDGPRRMDLADQGGVLDGIPASDLQLGDPNQASSRLPRYCMNGAALKFEPKTS